MLISKLFLTSDISIVLFENEYELVILYYFDQLSICTLCANKSVNNKIFILYLEVLSVHFKINKLLISLKQKQVQTGSGIYFYLCSLYL